VIDLSLEFSGEIPWITSSFKSNKKMERYIQMNLREMNCEDGRQVAPVIFCVLSLVFATMVLVVIKLLNRYVISTVTKF
jgi:hypothetical protein